MAFKPESQLFVFTMLTTIALVGCSNPRTPPKDARTPVAPETVAPSQPDSGPDAVAPPEPVSAPDIALEAAAVTGNVEATRQHIAAGTDLDRRDPQSGSTTLIAATALGQTETAILLIEGGADLELKNNEGSTALITAAFLCREEIVKALLANGADKNARNDGGATALDSVIGPFDEVKPLYDLLQGALGPLGLKLDYERIKTTRPKIAEMLR